MRIVAPVLMLVAASALAGIPPIPVDRDKVINQASELVPWCKAEAEYRYLLKDITPYQWAASYHDRSGVLFVDGKLRVHDQDVVVRCHVMQGMRGTSAAIEIDDPVL